MSEVRRAIVHLTSSPADFDEVMFSLVTMITDSLSDHSIVEAVVEDIFSQVFFVLAASIVTDSRLPSVSFC